MAHASHLFGMSDQVGLDASGCWVQAFEHPQNTAYGKIISTNNDLRSLGQNRAEDGTDEVRCRVCRMPVPHGSI